MAKPSRRALRTVGVLAVVVGGGALLRAMSSTPSSGPDDPPGPPDAPLTITLKPVGGIRQGEPARLTGAVKHADPARTTVVLERRSAGRWVVLEQVRRLDESRYGFLRMVGSGMFRAVAEQKGRTVAVSPPRRVSVLPDTARGPRLLPDLGPRKLTDCSPGERPCFTIVTTAGRRWLKFPVTAVNVGNGPLEIHGDRPSSISDDWIATRTTYHARGGRRSESLPGPDFFYARDEHNHWHIKDFDTYQVLDEAGATVRRGEKHAFCLEDNTTYRDWYHRPALHPRVPRHPAYKHEESCGQGHPRAVSFVEGLSPGWGDTYPSSLPDQGIDITDLSDGVYIVRVRIDSLDLVKESDEANNTATVRVRIAGDKVRAEPSTATGL